MEKEFVPYEQALELKELGFDGYSFAFYQSDRLKQEKILSGTQKYMREEDCKAPTFSQAFRFFREKYDCSHNITKTIGGEYIPYVNGYELDLDDNCEEVVGFKWIYKTYEEAELACLKKLIELVKTKK